MYTSQASLAAVSTNLANVNTTGASRVRVANAEQAVVQSDGISTGSGVDVASITRARDQMLDSTYREQNAKAGYWAVKNGNLEYMQEIMNEFESEDNGLQAMLTDFFNSWEELSKDPTSESNRQAVTEAAVSLISAVTELDEQLQQLQEDACTGVKDGVDALNDLAGQVAALNGQISQAEAGGGGEASYLRDQRDALLDEMSALANISTTESNGVLQVLVGGVTLVNGTTTHTLVVEGVGSSENPLTVKWAELNCDANITTGSIAAYLEDADPTGYETIDSGDIPYSYTTGSASSISTLRQALNDLITTLAEKINSLHSSGYGLDDSTGLDFFTAIDASQPLSITNIQVNPVLLDDPDKIAVSGVAGEEGNNTIAAAICDLNTEECYQFDGMPMDIDNFYEALTSWLGTAGSNAAGSYETQTALVTQIDNQRQSIFSISLDEELSSMIVYQNAYSAAARVLSTIDGLIGDLIEEIG
jgi:flagellar hook-associated protein 1 FlgK